MTSMSAMVNEEVNTPLFTSSLSPAPGSVNLGLLHVFIFF